MKPGVRQAFFATVALAALVMGCGHSVKDVCEDLADKCDTVTLDECTSDGNVLEEQAKSHGCDDVFDNYLDCVADQRCSFRAGCTAERAALEKCAGQFPD